MLGTIIAICYLRIYFAKAPKYTNINVVLQLDMEYN